MSPEQAAGESAVDARGDVYGLGAVAFFALIGRPPFQGKTFGQLLAAHRSQPPPDLSELRPDVPADLSAVIARCLAKDPANRFPTVAAVDRGTRRMPLRRRLVGRAGCRVVAKCHLVIQTAGRQSKLRFPARAHPSLYGCRAALVVPCPLKEYHCHRNRTPSSKVTEIRWFVMSNQDATQRTNPSGLPRFLPLLLVLFVGSGCSALIYEIVWFQLLQLVIGSSAVSLAVLLGTFMGGMCVGSLGLATHYFPAAAPLAGLRFAGVGDRDCRSRRAAGNALRRSSLPEQRHAGFAGNFPPRGGRRSLFIAAYPAYGR